MVRVANREYETNTPNGTWGCSIFVFILNWCIGNVLCVIVFFYTGDKFRMNFITRRFRSSFGSYYRDRLSTLSPGTYLFCIIGMILPLFSTMLFGLIVKEAVTHANSSGVINHNLNAMHFSVCMSPVEYNDSVTLSLGLLSFVCGFLSSHFKYKRMLTL